MRVHQENHKKQVKASAMEKHTINNQKPHVAILPSPAMGHIIPLTEFASRLVDHHGFSATFIVPHYGFPMTSVKSFLQTLPKTLNLIYLPAVNFDDLSADVSIETRIMLGMTRSGPALRDSLRILSESTRLVSLVVDVVGTDALDTAREMGLSCYIFMPLCAMSLSLSLYMPTLDESCTCEFRDLPDRVKIPGCVPVWGADLPSLVQDRKSDTYKWFLYHSKRYNLVDGIIINSFLDLEPGALQFLMEEGSGYKQPIYPIGPLLLSNPTNGGHGFDDGLRWLDQQPPRSVLYVSFGSSGTISPEQLTELAFGLEMSGQRFIWVVRIPNKNGANGVYFNTRGVQDPFDFLPKGFLDRTKGVGLVVQSWAPQISILSHGSTGGFFTHCGWNSILEGVAHGVPLIAWPLFAEQEMHATMLNEDLNVALRCRKNENGIAGRKEIAKCVRGLIVGEEGKILGKRMRELKDAAAMAISKGGSSTKSLDEITQIWKNHKTNII